MVRNVNGLSLDLIIHPGETIKEVLEDRNMSQEELAVCTGFSAKHVSEVINGKKSISSKFANSLEYALNIPTSFWINLQGIYDEETIELEKINNIEEKEFNVLRELKDIVSFCEDKNIIEKENNKSLTILSMRKILNLNNLTSIPNLPIQQVAFRCSDKVKVNFNILYAWQKLCEYFTDRIDIQNDFNKEKLRMSFNKIKNTMFLESNDMIRELKKIFLDCGIVFDVVQHFTGAPVQGYIQKRKDKVILCMTIRQSYSDIFWFTLFHEIAHLLNNDFDNKFIDYSFIKSEEENKADEFARNVLINNDDYIKFMANGNYSVSSIKKFADSQGVVPGIVVGRIQNDIKDYRFMANLKQQYKWM